MSAIIAPRSTEGAIRSGRAVLGRLVLELGVDLGADQDRQRGELQPQHGDDHRAEGPVGLVIGREASRVGREGQRGDEPQDGGHDGPRRHPAPLRVLPIRSEPVQDGQAADPAQGEGGPSEDHDGPPGDRAQRAVLERGRHDRHDQERDDEEQDRADGQAEGQGPPRDERTRLPFVIDPVDRRDQVLHPTRGRPQGQSDSGDQADPEPGGGGRGDALQLLGHEVPDLGGGRRQVVGHLPLNLGGVGDQPEQRHQRHQPRDNGDKSEERDTAREEDELIVLGLDPDPRPDVPPTLGGDVKGGLGAPTTVPGAARDAEDRGPISGDGPRRHRCEPPRRHRRPRRTRCP